SSERCLLRRTGAQELITEPQAVTLPLGPSLHPPSTRTPQAAHPPVCRLQVIRTRLISTNDAWRQHLADVQRCSVRPVVPQHGLGRQRISLALQPASELVKLKSNRLKGVRLILVALEVPRRRDGAPVGEVVAAPLEPSSP